LPEVSGLRHIIREIRYHEFSRQALGILLVVVFAVFAKPQLPLYYAGVPLVIAGIAVRLWASGHIKKNKILATDGPYGFVRHPLYVGNILILFGFVLCSSLWWAAAVAGVFFLLYYPTAIEYEDRKLESIFGEPWRKWRAETKALIPRLKPVPSEEKGHWSFMYSMRGNGEPIIALFLLFWLYFISQKLS
jgi:protein-S-isoprenylcysteine O-methyltransferase Ste14